MIEFMIDAGSDDVDVFRNKLLLLEVELLIPDERNDSGGCRRPSGVWSESKQICGSESSTWCCRLFIPRWRVLDGSGRRGDAKSPSRRSSRRMSFSSLEHCGMR